MTDELRAMMRADLDAERPPPIGDIVGAALRDGRRRRRNRRIGAGAVLAGAVALTVVLLADLGSAARPGQMPAAAPVGELLSPEAALSPGSVPIDASAPTAPPQARTLTIHSGTERAEGMQKKATSAAMLHLLTQLLPPGRTSHYGVAPDNDLRVQLYLDDGAGPGRVSVSVGAAGDGPVRADGSVLVTVVQAPARCAASIVVDAQQADGTTVRLDVAGCPGERPELTAEQAVAIAADPRWGVTMDEALVRDGAARFSRAPVLAS